MHFLLFLSRLFLSHLVYSCLKVETRIHMECLAQFFILSSHYNTFANQLVLKGHSALTGQIYNKQVNWLKFLHFGVHFSMFLVSFFPLPEQSRVAIFSVVNNSSLFFPPASLES